VVARRLPRHHVDLRDIHAASACLTSSACSSGGSACSTCRKYAIRIDYTGRTGEAYLKLLWFNADRRQRIVPTSQLYPAAR